MLKYKQFEKIESDMTQLKTLKHLYMDEHNNN